MFTTNGLTKLAIRAILLELHQIPVASDSMEENNRMSKIKKQYYCRINDWQHAIYGSCNMKTVNAVWDEIEQDGAQNFPRLIEMLDERD